MPSIKSLTITLIVALLIGGTIFAFTKEGSATPLLPQTITQTFHPTPTPTPVPTPIPINSSSDLKGEINQLVVPSYDSFFQTLHNETTSF